MWKRQEAFQLTDSEIALFDSVAQDVSKICATDIELFWLDLKKTTKDPFYDEAVERKFKGPFKIKAYVSYPAQAPNPSKDGNILTWDCTAWIARKDLEVAGAQPPNPGDVIRIWNTKFYNNEAVFDEKVPDSGFFFNVENVNPDGHIHDTPSFVGFKLTLKRRTDFTPERRITNT
jgi:hypothetical protein